MKTKNRQALNIWSHSTWKEWGHTLANTDFSCTLANFKKEKLCRHDFVTMSTGPWTRKDRCLFLFNDLLVITSVSKRSAKEVKRTAAMWDHQKNTWRWNPHSTRRMCLCLRARVHPSMCSPPCYTVLTASIWKLSYQFPPLFTYPLDSLTRCLCEEWKLEKIKISSRLTECKLRCSVFPEPFFMISEKSWDFGG